jgi:hypothetical protein
MAKDKLPADNPTSGLFDLAEHMSDNYAKVKHLKYYAYVFVGITIFFLIIISLLLLAEGNVGMFIIFMALVICGIMMLRLVAFTIHFLDDFDTNFRAIKLVREIDPLPKMPEGETSLERLEKYLKNDDPLLADQLKNGIEIKPDLRVGDTSWSLAFIRQGSMFGPESYLMLVREVKGEPKLGNFILLEKNLETVANKFMFPNRTIILCKAPKNYDGISDDLYSYLTEKAHYIVQSGKKQPIKLQLFVENEGRYEIIPLLP